MRIKLFISVLFISLFFLSSCNNDEVTGVCESNMNAEHSLNTDENIATKRFFDSVDSLNQCYSKVSTRGLLAKWGGRIFASVVDYSIGAVASAAISPFGGAIVGTLASYAYDDYWNNCIKKVEEQNNVNAVTTRTIIETTPTLVLSNKDNPTFVDSIGYYHNVLLAELRVLGKSYFDSNGNIDYEELLNDVTMIASDYHIASGEIDQLKKTHLFKLADSFIKKVDTENEDFVGTYFSQYGNSLLSNLGFSASKINSCRNLCSKIAEVVPYATEAELIEYGNNLHTLIDDSNLSDEDKESFKVMNDVAINSQVYWTTTGE